MKGGRRYVHMLKKEEKKLIKVDYKAVIVGKGERKYRLFP